MRHRTRLLAAGVGLLLAGDPARYDAAPNPEQLAVIYAEIAARIACPPVE